MSVTSGSSSIVYGQSTIIIVNRLTNVTITPSNSVTNIENLNGEIIATVEPTISTIYYVTGYTSENNSVSFNETIYVNVLVIAENNNITNYNSPIILSAYGSVSYYWYPSLYLNQTEGNTVICTPLNDIEYTIIGTDIFNTESKFKISITVDTNLNFTPSNPTVYEGNLLKINVTLSGNIDNINYVWRSTLTNYLPLSCANLRYGQMIKLHPYQNLDYIVNAYESDQLITSGNIKITIIPKPMQIIDVDILPYKLYNLIINRNSKGLKIELLKDRILAYKIMNFYYTTLQTAYRMEWTDKNGQTFKVKWITVYQIVNEIDGMLLGFEQQWKFFQFINNNQTRNNQTRSNFAFLLNNINQLYLEYPQQIYYIQQ